MGFENKVKSVLDDASGKLKESVGRTTGNQDLQVEGRLEQIEAKIRRTAEQAKNQLSE